MTKKSVAEIQFTTIPKSREKALAKLNNQHGMEYAITRNHQIQIGKAAKDYLKEFSTYVGSDGKASKSALDRDTGEARASGGEGIGVQLFADLWRRFDSGNATSYPTAELLRYLTEIDDAPWATYAKGKPMTARHLSRLLHPYGIFPHPIRLGVTVAKGYEVSDFADAFSRYLPSNGYTVTSQSNSGDSPDSLSVTQPACNRYENASLASLQAGCNSVTDRMEGTAAGRGGAANVADDNPDDWF